MGLLFEQVDVLTGTEAGVLKDAHLLVEGNRVTAMGEGPYHEPDDTRPAVSHERICAPGQLLMPAFYNAHTHVAMTLLRNYADDMDLHTWLFTKIFPMEACFDGAAVSAGTRLGLLEMLAGGTAGFVDMYDFCDETAEAVLDAGMRMLMTRGLLNGGTDGDLRTDPRLREARALHARWHGAGDGRIATGIGPHAVYTCTPAYLRAAAEEAARLGVTVHVHVDETRREHDECLAAHGMTPTALCESAGLFDGKAIAAHCVHVTDGDLAILARRGVVVAHNPRSNMKLASGFAPVLKARAAGIPVAIGTDGASSNNTLDMWAEMGLAALIHKGNTLDPLAVPAAEAFAMATRAGAQAMGLTDAGLLSVGARATWCWWTVPDRIGSRHTIRFPRWSIRAAPRMCGSPWWMVACSIGTGST
jgi:5-methylthioadenosine/S-adenosylhomocysteine deaminase